MKLMETLLVGGLKMPGVGALLRPLLLGLHRLMVGAMKRADRHWVRPRNWSNAELRQFGRLFTGDILNVSGWRDEDKNGGHYRDYFPAARSYSISNYSGECGVSGVEGEVFLDLENPLPPQLHRKYQVVLNHTTVEHVYDIRTAIANLCALSDDVVILVTPFLQQVHWIDGSFGDWWRPTPMCLNRLLAEQGFEVHYQSANDNPWYIVYVFTVARRTPVPTMPRLPASGVLAGNVGETHFGIQGKDAQ
ncbi:hypothetical protein [Chitiniphilus shinanonensis]|uniref:hypothetical protein n=1 Tax=Chitiniphilus shinanonensis TaxID=553088 RepID=UPI00307438EA